MLTSAQRESNVVRLSRFLRNDGVRVDEWYEPQSRSLLQRLAKANTEIRLIIDGSKVGSNHQLLMLSVAYRRRAIPLIWTWVKHQRGHSTVALQKVLLKQLHKLIPETAKVSLVGDSEFGNPDILKLIESWGWFYALRQSGRELYQTQNDDWHKLSKAVQEGESKDLVQVIMTKVHQHPTRLIAHWHKGEKQAWLLATNYPTKHLALKAYKYRMWIEEMFADLKGNGFDLEATRLRSADKLHRLTLVVCLLYLWLIAFAVRIIKWGRRKLVDRKSRRDLSIFRIGFDTIHRYLANDLAFSIFLMPYP
jgi:hypothetical protein